MDDEEDDDAGKDYTRDDEAQALEAVPVHGSFQLPLQIIVVGISPANATALFISIWSSVIVSSNTSLDDASSSCWMIVGVSARIDMLKGEIQCSASTEPIGLRTSGRRTSSPKKIQLKFQTIQLLL